MSRSCLSSANYKLIRTRHYRGQTGSVNGENCIFCARYLQMWPEGRPRQHGAGRAAPQKVANGGLSNRGRGVQLRLIAYPAQLDRASDYGSEGYRFNSCQVRHIVAGAHLAGLCCQATGRELPQPQRRPVLSRHSCAEQRTGPRPDSAEEYPLFPDRGRHPRSLCCHASAGDLAGIEQSGHVSNLPRRSAVSSTAFLARGKGRSRCWTPSPVRMCEAISLRMPGLRRSGPTRHPFWRFFGRALSRWLQDITDGFHGLCRVSISTFCLCTSWIMSAVTNGCRRAPLPTSA